MLRPDVVWYGEMLPRRIFMEAEWAAEQCDLFLLVGTSGVVYPAASLPLAAAERGAFVLEINTEPTDLSPRVSTTILGKAGEVLPEIVRSLRSRPKESP
jgi:NAD-dependent deacetylase